MGSADQQVALTQETTRRIVEPAPLMRASIQPGHDFALATMQDDGSIFAINNCIYSTNRIFFECGNQI